MQVNQLEQIKEKLMGKTIPKYWKLLTRCCSILEAQAVTTDMFKEVMEVLYPGKTILIKDNIELPSEVIEEKEPEILLIAP